MSVCAVKPLDDLRTFHWPVAGLHRHLGLLVVVEVASRGCWNASVDPM
jgi:hypothetical protein